MNQPRIDEIALMARIDGTLPPDEAAALDARIASDPALAGDAAAMAALSAELETLGGLLPVDAPEINITAEVVQMAHDIGSGLRPAHEDGLPEDTEFIARLEGEEDAVFTERLAADTGLQQELAETEALWRELEALGSAYLYDVPGIDIQDAVFERLGDVDAGRVADDLNRLGDLSAVTWPEINIVEEVMTAVAESKNRPENVVPFRTRPKPNQARLESGGDTLPWLRKIAAAAVAVMLFSLGYLYRDLAVPAEVPVAAQTPETQTGASMRLANNEINRFRSTDDPREVRSRYQDERLRLPDRPEGREDSAADSEVAAETPRAEFAARPGVEDIFNARRAAMMKDAEALASLADWAALSPEEALQILKDLGYTSDAILAAVPFLSSDDAVALLEGAVGKDPSNPLLRAALAENLMESGAFDEGHLQLAEWSKTDKENGLPAYYEAQLLFAEGNVYGGLGALENAAAYAGVNTYSRQRAQSHEAALRAAGMDADSASLLAGITANDGDYAQLDQLGRSLLEQGKALAADGDYEGAARSFEAALQLGEQVQGQAQFMNEASAALVLQQDAYNAMNQLNSMATMSEEMLAYLSETNREIVAGFEQLNALYQSMNDLIANGDPSGITNYISGLITGEVPLFFGF